MWSVPFVVVLVAIVLVARRRGFFETQRDQRLAGFLAVGTFGAYLIDRISAGYSPYASVVGALVVSVVLTAIVLVLVRLRGKRSL